MANSLLYGFHQLKDHTMTLVSDVDQGLLMSSIGLTQQQHEQEVNAFINLFADRTTDLQRRFKGGTLTRSQPLDENGRPLPIKPGVPYTVGFPIWASGNAWGANYVTAKKMTVQDVNDMIAMMYEGDFIWLRDQLLGLLFRNTSLTFTDPQFGAVTVQGLANGDAVTYVNNSGSLGTDSHFAAQAAAVADATNPFDDIYLDIVEHPQNGNRVISFINTAQTASVTGLTNFIDVLDPDLIAADNATRLRINSPGSVTLPGSAKILGKTDQVWVAEWNAVPAGYIVSLAIDAANKPVLMRQDPESQLQGFRRVAEEEVFPYGEEIWFRRAGFGAWNRVGARIDYVGTSGTYAVPTGYTIPMA